MRQFLACSAGRVYGVNAGGDLAIMDRRSGQVLSTLPIPSHPVRMVNDQTDRIYLATETGAVICLRETMQDKPIHFRELQEEKKAVTVTGTEKVSSGGDEEESDENDSDNSFDGAKSKSRFDDDEEDEEDANSDSSGGGFSGFGNDNGDDDGDDDGGGSGSFGDNDNDGGSFDAFDD